MTEYYIKTRSYELLPNKQMKAILDRNCDYRRFCWNEALALWNDEYDSTCLSIFIILAKKCYNTFI